MPIVGPSSFVPTTQEFLTHWGAADTALGVGNEIVLQGGVARVGLQTLLDTLVAKRLDLAGKLNLAETARGDIELQKIAMLLRINQFNDVVRADFGGTKWEVALPKVPSIGDGEGVFIPPLDDVQTLWLQLNAGIAPAGPVKLLGDYVQATFGTNNGAMKTAFTTWRAAGVIAGLALQERNDIQDQIQPVLVNYRKKLPTKFAKGHALVDSLPEVSPPPGSTPAAVTINVVWDPITLKAKITWGASTAADLFQYEIRFCAGPNYNTEIEDVIGNVTPGGLLEFLSDAGLAAAGNIASFKVYVITTTGNEKGSNAVSVTRV